MRISEKNGTNSAKNHGKRMNFHRVYEHHKSFIEFWSVSALFHFTKRGSAKSEQHVCFSPSCDPIQKSDHHKHAFSQGNNAFHRLYYDFIRSIYLKNTTCCSDFAELCFGTPDKIEVRTWTRVKWPFGLFAPTGAS